MTQEHDDHGERDQLEHEHLERIAEEKRAEERKRLEQDLLNRALVRARRNRLQFSTAIASTLAGFVVLFGRNELLDFFPPNSRIFVYALGIAFLGTGAALVMLQYLRGAMSSDLLDLGSGTSIGGGLKIQSAREIDLDRQISDLHDEMLTLRTAIDLSSSISSHASSIDSETSISDIAARLDERLSDDASQAAHIREIRATFVHSRDRLEHELQSLGFRGNLNLVIGVLTSVFAIGLLSFMVVGTAQNFDNLPSILSHYVPRISVVLFIEVFSFFFLRLYRTTLSEIRTYQGDITNLCLKQIAVEAVWGNIDNSSRTSLSKDLIASAMPSDRKASDSEKPAVDPKLVAELLQKFGEVILKKGKKDE